MSIVTYVDNLVSLSRTQARIAQDYKAWMQEPGGDRYRPDYERLRLESVRHMRTAHSWRDRYYEVKESKLALKESAE